MEQTKRSVVRSWVKLPEFISSEGGRLEEHERDFTIMARDVVGTIHDYREKSDEFIICFTGHNGMMASCKFFADKGQFNVGDRVVFDIGENVVRVALNVKLKGEN